MAGEAGSGKLSFDVSAPRLALWWQGAEGRCRLESTREKVVVAKAQSQILALLSPFSIVHQCVSESRSSQNNVLGLAGTSKKCASLAE